MACLAHCRIMSDLFGNCQGASKSSLEGATVWHYICRSLKPQPIARERERLIASRPAPPDFLVLPRSHSLQAEGGLQWRCPAAT